MHPGTSSARPRGPWDVRSIEQVGEEARNLLEAGCLDQAELLLREHLQKRPADADVQMLFARVAQRREAFSEALRRWEALLELGPDRLQALVGKCVALRKLERLDELSATL